MELVFATHNQNKAIEIKNLLPDFVTVKTLTDIGCLEEIPEDYPTLEENALQKARYVADKFGVNCFADDTGLEISSLNGEPGVYSARYAGPERDSENNMDLVLQKLGNSSEREAQFRTVIALILNGKEFTFEGIVKGEISKERHGEKGFGYDPIFYPENQKKTFAEMTLDEKNAMSHRGRAIHKLKEFLEKK